MDNLASAVHTVYLSEKTFDYYVTNFENQGKYLSKGLMISFHYRSIINNNQILKCSKSFLLNISDFIFITNRDIYYFIDL